MKKFLITILVVFCVAVIAVIIWLSTLDGKYDVQRSVTINQPASEVFPLVQDFNQWTTWSPWLCMEPEAEVKISGNGTEENDTYSWSGELVGSGTISHLKIVPDKSIDQEIIFKEPMASTSTVYWEFSDVNDSTVSVTWGMKGEMPFYLRFMAKMMDTYIGMDYDRGLKMLKDYAEKGYVPSRVEIVGVVDAPEIKYVGEKVSCSIQEVGDKMKNSFNHLNEAITGKNVSFEYALCIYHEFDFVSGHCEYTAALPIKDSVDLGSGFNVGVMPVSRALKIKFTGDYEHLGNAWSAGMSYMRTNKLEESKDAPPYEVYITDPMKETDPRNWITEIYMPVK